MTRRRLVLLVSAGVLFTLGLIAVTFVLLATRTTTGRDRLRGLVQSYITGKVHNGTIYLGHMSGSLITNVTFDSIEIKDKRGEILLATGRATFFYNPRDLIDQRVVITHAAVEHPYLHVIEHENGKWNFQEIFESGAPPVVTAVPKAIDTRGWGDYFVVDSLRASGGTIHVTQPWHPDDTLRGPARDSAIRVHLTNPFKAVSKTFDGYGRTYSWTKLRGIVPHARLADPDSNKFGQMFTVDSLSADEFEPTFQFRNVRGMATKLGDSVWIDVPHFELPASLASAKGKVWWGSNLPTRYDVNVHGDSVTLDDIKWVWPKLPRTGGGTLDLSIKNDPDPTKLHLVNFKISNMDMRSTKSHLTGAMTFTSGAPVLPITNVDLRLDPMDFDLLRVFNGKPFTQDWQGRLLGTVKGRGGPLTQFRVDDARLTFNDAHVPGAVSRVNGRGELDIFDPAFTVFHGFHVDATSVDLRTIEYLFPNFPRLHGFASGTATLDSSWLDVRFSDARVALQDGEGEPTRLTGSGRITYGDLMSYDVALNAEPLSLTMIARSYPNPLRGLYSGPIRAKGTAPDLETTFSLQGPAGALSFDGRLDLDSIGGIGARGSGEFSGIGFAALLEKVNIPTGLFSGHYQLALRGETAATLQGDAQLSIQRTVFDGVRIYPSYAHLKFGDGRMTVADSVVIRTAAGTLLASGGIGLPGGRPDSLRFTVGLDSLGGLRRYISHPDTSRLGAAETPPDSLAGSLALSGLVFGTFDSVNVTGKLTGSDLYFNKDRGRSLSGKLDLVAAGARMSGSLEARIDTVTLVGIALDTVGGVVRFGDTKHAAFELSALSNNGPTARALGTWRQELTGQHVFVVDSLGLAVGNDRWRLMSPATVTIDSTAVRLDSVAFRNLDSAFISLAATIPESGAAVAQLRAARIPLKDFGILAQAADTVTGMADVTVAATGSRQAPIIAADATLTSVKWEGVDIDRVTAQGRYDRGRLNANMDLVRKGQTAVAANASLPLDITLPLTTRWRSDTIGGFIRADSTDLSLMQTVFGSTISSVSGRLSANVRASGTPRAPVASGWASISNGSAFIRSAGVTVSDIHAYIQGGRDAAGHDSIRVDSIVASTREPRTPVGRARITGWVTDLMRRNGDPTFSLALGLDLFHAYNRRSVAEVFVSTPTRTDSIRLRGSVNSSTLTGALRVDRGSLFLADREIARKQAVQSVFAADTAVVGGNPTRPTSAMMQKLITNLQIDNVPVTLGNDVRLRSKDANVRLVGVLQLQTSDTRATRTLATGELVKRLGLNGTLRTESGTYNLNLGVVQRDLAVIPGGTVDFDGPPENPTLDIQARYDVRQVRDFGVLVRLHGRVLPYPVIDFSNTGQYQYSTSDLLSYLLIGSPGFDFAKNAGTTQTIASIIGPTVSSIAVSGLRRSLGSWVDAVQFQIGGAGQQGTEATTAGQSEYKAYLYGSTIGAEKQFGSNVYVNVNTGFCQFYYNAPGQGINPLYGLGAKAEYRFDPKISFKLAYDPPTQNRSCTQQSLIGLVPTPTNFSFSLTHVWRF